MSMIPDRSMGDIGERVGFIFRGCFVGGPVVLRFAPYRGMGGRCSACLVAVAMIVMPREVRSDRRCLRVGTRGGV